MPGHHVVAVRLDQKYAGVMVRKELVSGAIKVRRLVGDDATKTSVSWSTAD